MYKEVTRSNVASSISLYFHKPEGKRIFFISPKLLQPVRRYSALVLTVTVNGMLQIHPVIYLLFKLNNN